MEYLESMGNGMVISSIANSIMKKEAFAESLSNVQFNQLVINLLKLNATDSNNITDNVLNIFQNGKFKFNGKDRFREKDFKFFTESQIWSKQSGNPVIPGINCYSFALKPEKHQPSGTCNFSRLDKVEFLFTLKKNWRNVSPNASIPSENIPHVYTFSIFKQSHIPTQDITNIYNNLSDVQIDSSKLYILDMYAVNYNILRIMGGMGDVAFAN